ncbi:hypothetical protein M407DRAFT_80517 [Tulasnella calospora MUT 4182]|uniref:Maf/Ham1 n=1 Tax=Tulasnella calospora MUT 4182 TaxID=1051891 RepID=A0A0C3Q9N4_9AGAM|nr:hypothetical protein M407DRAFT_80517 [Tulasnella calospora MUT 4182]
MASVTNKVVLPHALKTPAFTKLSRNKRVVLASASPRRKAILITFLVHLIIPSTFEETSSHTYYSNVYEYPVATATEKAVEVYERLVHDDPENLPDLPFDTIFSFVSADTVVLSRIEPATSNLGAGLEHDIRPEILEKPTSKADNLRMLLDMNGRSCEVVTGVSVVFPIPTAPGHPIKLMDERSVVYFADNAVSWLEAYVDKGEGLDRAGGFTGLGGILIRKVDGDWHNVVGFPAAAFFKFLEILVEEQDDFLAVD